MSRIWGTDSKPVSSPSWISLREGGDKVALRVADRCDRCGAQAYMLAMKGDSDLLFCAHHGRQHFDALVVDGWDVNDETHTINQPSPVSASH